MRRSSGPGCLVHQDSSDPSTITLSGLRIFEDLGGRFRLLRFIARGGMGEVYEAEDLAVRSRPRVALKVLRKEIAANALMLARFEQEVEISKNVTHPNVCRTYDLGLHQCRDAAGNAINLMFLTMEFLSGQTLAAYLHAKGRLTTTETLPIIRQLAAGLDAIHAAGVVHADLKPSNIIVIPALNGGEMRTVITDFGLAVPISNEVTRHMQDRLLVGGTPDYMAPEQAIRCALDSSADIYAFGLILYRMISGVLPCEGSGSGSRHSASPERLRHHLPDLEPPWEEAILRCLSIDPEQRFDTAADVVAALIGPHEHLGGRQAARSRSVEDGSSIWYNYGNA